MRPTEVSIKEACTLGFTNYQDKSSPSEPNLFWVRFPRARLRVVYGLGPRGFQALMWPTPPFFLRELSEWSKECFTKDAFDQLKHDFEASHAKAEGFPFLGEERARFETAFAKRMGSEVVFHSSFLSSFAIPDRDETFQRLMQFLGEWFNSMGDFAFQPILPAGWEWLNEWRASPLYRLFNQHHKALPLGQKGQWRRLLIDLQRLGNGDEVSRLRNCMREQPSVTLNVSGYWRRIPGFMRMRETTPTDPSDLSGWEEVYAQRAHLVRKLNWPLFYAGVRTQLTAVDLPSVSSIPEPGQRSIPTSHDVELEARSYCTELEKWYPLLISHPLETMLGVRLSYTDYVR